MRKLGLAVLAIAFVCGGCVAVSAKGNRFAPDAQVFVYKDHVYVLQPSSGQVYEVDVRDAKPFEGGCETNQIE